MTTQSSLDRIERRIDIDASAERVWELVSTPGWWINDGDYVEHEVVRDGDLATVRDPVHGEFVLRVEALDAPRYAAFRWFSGTPIEARTAADLAGGSTLVEFTIEPRESGGVTLHVLESGFESLDRSDEERRKLVDDNTEGWETELAVARRTVTGTGR